MKKIAVLLTLVWSGYAFAANPVTPQLIVKDTVVVNIGEKSKIMILVDNPTELKELSEYDLNAIVEELSQSMDTAAEKEEYVKIEDETGEKFLKEETNGNGISETEQEAIKREVKNEMEEMKEELREEYEGYYKKRKKYQSGTRTYFNFEFGMNNYMENGKFPSDNNELYTVKPWGSWYPALTVTNRSHIAGPLFFDWGGGISWYNFKHQNFSTRLEKTEFETVYYDDPAVPSPIKSKLSVTYLNVNLVPILNFGKTGKKRDLIRWDNYDNGFRIGIGGYVGYRIKSWTKYTWRENGNKQKNHNHDHFYLNNVRWGARFVFGFRALDMFVNYDISELYAEGRGPRLNPFSFGFIL